MSIFATVGPRILHVNFSKQPPLGVVEQLKGEVSAVKKLGLSWDTVLIGATECNQTFYVKQLPYLPGPIRWFFVYLFIIKNQKRYDIVLMRCIKADFLGWFFVPFLKNFIYIHHTKEIEECLNVKPAWYGIFLSKTEEIFGRLKLRKTKAIAAVTQEIANYENSRIKNEKELLIIPNGIDSKCFEIIEDKRSSSINVIFVASKFEQWHGLDLLLNSYRNNSNCKLYLHLVGKISALDIQDIHKINNYHKRIFTYGSLSRNEILNIMQKCDLGLGSFGLFRNKLSEACTLKTREYLACGLPVYANHDDSGLPKDFRFFIKGKPDIEEITKNAISLRRFSRKMIAESSFRYIDKANIVSQVYKKLQLII